MPNQRSADQRPVIVMMRKSFVDEIDEALCLAGYWDRATFIRDAVYEKLKEIGVEVPLIEKTAPPRKGKGGTPTHKKPNAKQLIEKAVNDSLADYESRQPTRSRQRRQG